MRNIFTLSIASVALLTACDSLSGPQIYPATPKADYSIHVVKDANGKMVALPPECPAWSSSNTDPYDNQPLPQFGCATARNLALMVERPEDLVKGRDMGAGRAVTTVGAIRRYDNNQTRGLIYPSSAPDTVVDVTTAPTGSSAMTGDVTGGAASSSSSSSSSAAAPAAAAP